MVANLDTKCLGHFSEYVYLMENGVATHQSVLIKVHSYVYKKADMLSIYIAIATAVLKLVFEF